MDIMKNLVLAASGAIALAGCGSSSDTEENSAQKQEVISITANDLYKAFENNKLDAYNRYGGKTIKISGFFSSVDKEVDGRYSIEMSVAVRSFDGEFAISPYQYVKLYTPESRGDGLSALAAGDLITMTCEKYPDPEDTLSWAVLEECGDVKVLGSGNDGRIKYLQMMTSEKREEPQSPPSQSSADQSSTDESNSSTEDQSDGSVSEAEAAADEAMSVANEF